MAPKILTSKQVSPKSDVYSFGVLLMEPVNGSSFILHGNEIDIHRFIKWAKNIHVQKDGFEEIFHVLINNSIIGVDHIEAKLFLQISPDCIQVTWMDNVLCLSLNLWSNKFQIPKIMDSTKYLKQFEMH
jgi:serine/threonine protein kinase